MITWIDLFTVAATDLFLVFPCRPLCEPDPMCGTYLPVSRSLSSGPLLSSFEVCQAVRNEWEDRARGRIM